MRYAIIAGWDAQKRVTRYNYTTDETYAKALMDRLRNGTAYPEYGFPVVLPVQKRSPKAYYAKMPAAASGTKSMQHRARFWKADPVAKKVTFDTAACHSWCTRMLRLHIDAEADRRIDKLWSPISPARAARVRAEMENGEAKAALIVKGAAIRARAMTLKKTLVIMTPEGVLALDASSGVHWAES